MESNLNKNATESSRNEFEFFIFKIFGKKVRNNEFAEIYFYYEKVLEKIGETSFDPLIDRIVKEGLDIEAIEFYLRLKSRNNPITVRLNSLMYLVETQNEFYDFFVNPKNNLLFGFFNLAFFSVRSVFLFLKGYIIYKVYA